MAGEDVQLLELVYSDVTNRPRGRRVNLGCVKFENIYTRLVP